MGRNQHYFHSVGWGMGSTKISLCVLSTALSALLLPLLLLWGLFAKWMCLGVRNTLEWKEQHSGFSLNLVYDFPFVVSKHYWNLVKIIRGLGFRESFSVVRLGWSKTSILLGFLKITEMLTRCLLSPNTETAASLSWIRIETAFSSSH